MLDAAADRVAYLELRTTPKASKARGANSSRQLCSAGFAGTVFCPAVTHFRPCSRGQSTAYPRRHMRQQCSTASRQPCRSLNSKGPAARCGGRRHRQSHDRVTGAPPSPPAPHAWPTGICTRRCARAAADSGAVAAKHRPTRGRGCRARNGAPHARAASQPPGARYTAPLRAVSYSGRSTCACA